MYPEEIQYKGFTIKIEAEENPQDPREPGFQDHLGTMICFHKRYSLGDETDLTFDEFDGWKDLKKYIIKELKSICIMPIYMYDHSGITIQTTPYGDNWDSGQIGFIYCTEKDRDKMGTQKKDLERILMGEVKEYDKYLTGEIYRYSIFKYDEDLNIGCGNWYGDQKDIIKDARASIESHIKYQKKKADELMINYNRVRSGESLLIF